jgi:hypothetical protein
MTDRLPSVTIVRRIKAAPAKVWAAIPASVAPRSFPTQTRLLNAANWRGLV